MRKSKHSVQEVAEMDEMKATDIRKGGLGLISVRDRGWARLDNGVVLRWHSNRPASSETEIDGHVVEIKNSNVPSGTLVMTTEHGDISFNAEELMRLIRWA